MAKGKRYTNKSIASSSKKSASQQREDVSSSDGANSRSNSPKNIGTNYNFTITVYKQSNGQYSLYDNSSLLANNINYYSNYQNPNIILSNNSNNEINTETINKKFINKKDNHPVNYSLNFKNKNFESKIRAKTEKNYRNSKNMKNLGKEGKDAISYKIYCDIEAGPSILPKKKYCDFTGLTSNYNELHTGIRYYNSKIYKMSQNIPQPIKDQYLTIRKALIRLK